MAIQVARGGCAIMASGYKGTPRTCEREVTHVGLHWSSYDMELWLVFACSEHAQQLEVARPLLDRDLDELQRRREHERLQLAGKPTT